MSVIEEKIIDTFLLDEELFRYVERKVAKRLPAGPHLKSDFQWYKQVIDLTINEAFDDFQVVETLNHQISQLEKYLKKKSLEKKAVSEHNKVSINGNGNEKIDDSGNENMNPNYSFSEPIQQQPKQKRISKTKLLNHKDPNSRQNDVHIPTEKNDQREIKFSNPELQHDVKLADRSVRVNSPMKSKNFINSSSILNNSESQDNNYNIDSLIDIRTSIESDAPRMLESADVDVGSPVVSPKSGDYHRLFF